MLGYVLNSSFCPSMYAKTYCSNAHPAHSLVLVKYAITSPWLTGLVSMVYVAGTFLSLVNGAIAEN